MIGWTSLAREVRGKFLSLRFEDFIIAARLDGLSNMEVIRKHMVPSFSSHIIASLTLAVPLMILAETSLSFLGVGLQPPGGFLGHLAQGSSECSHYHRSPMASDRSGNDDRRRGTGTEFSRRRTT